MKLRAAGRLPERPVVYANGDNLLDADLYDCYRQSLQRAAACGIDAEECVIDVAALVPWEESGDYGALERDEIDYAAHEGAVKYESLYARAPRARQGRGPASSRGRNLPTL